MAHKAISGLVADSRAILNKAILSADQSKFLCSNPRLSFKHFSFEMKPKRNVNIVEILSLKNKRMRLRIIVSALPNEDNEAKAGRLDFFANSEPLLSLGSNMSLEDDDDDDEDEDEDEISAFSHSSSDLSMNGNDLVDEANILDKLKAVRLHVLASEQWNASQIKLCQRKYSASSTNLIHYLALKWLDIEQVKEDLSSVSVLNWEIVNSCVVPSLNSGIQLLENLTCNSLNGREESSDGCTEKRSGKPRSEKLTLHFVRKKAFSNMESLLGPLQDDKTTHVMVTVGKEAIEDEMLVINLIKKGASIIRINCAHGDPSVWSEIVRRVRTSSQMLEKQCRILMDLAGPKLRTGNLNPGPHVLKISPTRNASGCMIVPAQVWLSHKEAGPPPTHISPDASLFIDDPAFLSQLEVGNILRFNDARGKKRILKISRKLNVFSGIGLVAECTRTCYIESGTRLFIKVKKGKLPFGQVIDVPALEPYVRLRVGDIVVISRDSSCNQIDLPVVANGTQRITCQTSLLFDSVEPGEPIAFDDGKILGVIEGTSMSEIIVSITHTRPSGTKLGPEKSINIPESNIRFEGLTSKDLMDLEFVASQADMVGVSFVRDVHDIVMLRQELEKRKLWNLGIVLKIETKSGFENLPQMLLEAMKSPNPLGVMIARGDLAVECGWERLADIQAEILSICSAAHIPVIWATQVLESYIKFGVPTRAEITDVSNGKRSSCIMLNKGKHIVEAVSFLGTIVSKNSEKMKDELKPRTMSGHFV